jgi:hypothetical protein
MEWERISENRMEQIASEIYQQKICPLAACSFPTVKKKLPAPFVFSLLLLQQFLSFCQSLNLASTLEYQN